MGTLFAWSHRENRAPQRDLLYWLDSMRSSVVYERAEATRKSVREMWVEKKRGGRNAVPWLRGGSREIIDNQEGERGRAGEGELEMR